MEIAVLVAVIAAIGLAVWWRARKTPDWRLFVCSGHAGDAVEKCEACSKDFCKECSPDGHCVPTYGDEKGRWAGSL